MNLSNPDSLSQFDINNVFIVNSSFNNMSTELYIPYVLLIV